jgi:hypothetical protein
MPVAAHAFANDHAVDHVEGNEQVGRAIVHASSSQNGPDHQQGRLRTIQYLLEYCFFTVVRWFEILSFLDGVLI